MATMKTQITGKNAHSFNFKLEELDNFIKPFIISKINRSWAKEISSALVNHYESMLTEKLKIIKDRLFSQPQIAHFSSKALEWAKSNYRKKLSHETITSYLIIVRDIGTNPYESMDVGSSCTPSETVAKLSSAVPLQNRFTTQSNPQRTTGKRLRSPDQTIDTPTKNRKTILNYQTSPRSQSVPTTSSTPPPVRTTPSSDKYSTPPSPSRPIPLPRIACSSKPIYPSLPTVNSKPSPIPPQKTSCKLSMELPRRHDPKNKGAWHLLTINKPILIIGSSNISNIAKGRDDVQMESYPSGKIWHIKTILSNLSLHPISLVTLFFTLHSTIEHKTAVIFTIIYWIFCKELRPLSLIPPAMSLTYLFHLFSNQNSRTSKLLTTF
ncbi:hypothetical protein LOTGIDRAFT_159394 [Lottia gigantea]|uniref:Uncharacterized protein n=1 Tax=Lottia gigantea TaxID=225164 RepID=V4AJV2_LOTGI|nr:hypothetical protein LOTGIDRAFT_159394 [Lottia gigantea]ESO97362.1 hypothetical protein LOTGIDRAFT_159394 [Lottia gigantea]